MRYLLVIAIALSVSQASAAQQPRLTTWDFEKDGTPKTYEIGGYKLTLTANNVGDEWFEPRLSVMAPGMPPISLTGEEQRYDIHLDFTALKLSSGERPSVVFTSFTGGMHCCIEVTVLQPTGHRWRKLDLGTWDGTGIYDPRDVDGDGVVDFLFDDNAFLKEFGPESFQPPIILNVVGGEVVDVSKAKRYSGLYKERIKDDKLGCAEGANSACAAYVAESARIGRFDEAWKFMLSNYEHAAKMMYPSICEGRIVGHECEGNWVQTTDFPKSLRSFLVEYEYIQK